MAVNYNMDKRVLIVEDDKNSCDALCRLLKRKGIQTDCADSFTTGLEFVRRNSFDAAIVDLNLPDSAPMETIARITELHPTHAIAFTGVDDPDIIRECQRRNLRFILKGTSATGIIREVLLMLEWVEPSRQIEEAILENQREERRLAVSPWYHRLAPVMAVVLTLCSTTAVGGAYLFNIVSDKASKAEQTRQHFDKLDLAIIEERDAIKELRTDAVTVHTQNQISIDDRINMHGQIDTFRVDVIRRLERIEDAVRGPIGHNN